MICCLFAAMVLAPFGLWTIPKSGSSAPADCCDTRWLAWMLPLTAFAATGLCLAAWFVWLRHPALFHAICRTLPGF